MPAPGIYHVIGTEVNGGRRIESAPFKDGYYDDPGYEIEYWLEPIDITEDRPVLKNFFGEDVSLDDVHETYIKAKPLFQYAQALEEYIDSLLAKSKEEAWISIKDKLPESGMMVIAYGLTSYQKHRRIRAFYAPHLTIEQYDDDYIDLDYDEKLDRYCIPEGWYEANEYEDTHWKVSIPITHWMPLPEPPLTAFGKEGEG